MLVPMKYRRDAEFAKTRQKLTGVDRGADLQSLRIVGWVLVAREHRDRPCGKQMVMQDNQDRMSLRCYVSVIETPYKRIQLVVADAAKSLLHTSLNTA